MPRRNRRAGKRSDHRETAEPTQELSGRNNNDIGRMARALVDAGLCSPMILGPQAPRKEGSR